MLHEKGRPNWSVLLAIALFLALLLVASGQSAWVVSAQGSPPPPPPTPPAPPSPPTSEASNSGSEFFTFTPGDVPTEDAGGAFRAPGNNRSGIKIVDDTGKVVHTFPPPGLTICFQVNMDAFNQTPESLRTIEWWDGRQWVAVPTTIAGPTDGNYQMCTTVTQL